MLKGLVAKTNLLAVNASRKVTLTLSSVEREPPLRDDLSTE
jgi:hypothetical protein